MENTEMRDRFLDECMDRKVPVPIIMNVSELMVGKTVSQCEEIAAKAIALLQVGALTKETAKRICLEDSEQ